MIFSLPVPSLFVAGIMLCQFRRHSALISHHRKITRMSTQSMEATYRAEDKFVSPTSLNCWSQSTLEPSPPQINVYDLSQINRYLEQIEDCCMQSSTTPALRYQHCYSSDDNKTFFKVVGSVLAKPMLRTLIYGGTNNGGSRIECESNVIERSVKSKKIHFDERIREARARIEIQRMYSFVTHSLQPIAEALDADVRNEKVPELLDRINEATINIQKDNARPNTMLSRLASGRRYQGKLDSLVSDIFPEMLDKYHDACQKATEREVLENVVNADLVEQHHECDMNGDESCTEQRITAAFKCLDRFYPIEADQSRSIESGDSGVESGKKCEESLIAFLHSAYEFEQSNTNERYKILQNVYINARRNGEKIRKAGRQILDSSSSGIIWTDLDRHRLCSELDAIVLSCESDSDTFVVSSIWEAKKKISPSTLHDILTKKLQAIEALTDDQSAEVVYCNDDGESQNIPFVSRSSQLSFNIYGSELQTPENAADSIRSIAAARVINRNLEEVILSLERDDVMVEVDVAETLNIIQGLKSVAKSIQRQNRIQVKFFLEEGEDYEL